MGQFPNDYSPVTANELDGTEEIFIDASGTKYILSAELKKYLSLADVNEQTASYQLVAADEGKIVRMNVAGSNSLTVPPNTTVAFPLGTQIILRQAGAGTTTITPGSGVTINGTPLAMSGQHASAALVKIGTNEWDLYIGGEAVADETAPTVQSATAINSTTIRVVFDEVVTATNVGWSFKKNGAAHNPTSVSGSGTNTLDFTVPSMVSSDTILRTYASGSGNTIDAATNELVSFSDQAVTNSIPAPPEVTAMSIDEDGILVSFDQSVTATNVGWSFEADGSPITLTGVSQPTGSTLLFAYSTSVTDTDTVTGSYDSATGDTEGNTDELVSFTDDPVTNNIEAAATLANTAWANHYDFAEATAIETEASGGDTLLTRLWDQKNKVNYPTVASDTLVQTTSANKPKLIASGINSLPSVEVDGTPRAMVANSTSSVAKPVVRCLAVEFKQIGLSWFLWSGSASGTASIGIDATGKLQLYGGTAIVSTFTVALDTPYILWAEFDAGGTARLYVNDPATPVLTGNAGAHANFVSDMIGRTATAGTYRVWLADYALHSGLLSSAARTSIMNEMKTKYGI